MSEIETRDWQDSTAQLKVHMGEELMQRVNYGYDGIDQFISEVSTETPMPQINSGYAYDAMGNRNDAAEQVVVTVEVKQRFIELASSSPDLLVYLPYPTTTPVAPQPTYVPVYAPTSPPVPQATAVNEDDDPLDVPMEEATPEPYSLNEDEVSLPPEEPNYKPDPVVNFAVRWAGYDSWSAELKIYSVTEGGVLGSLLASCTIPYGITTKNLGQLLRDKDLDPGVYVYDIELTGEGENNNYDVNTLPANGGGDGHASHRLNKDITIGSIDLQSAVENHDTGELELEYEFDVEVSDSGSSSIESLTASWFTPGLDAGPPVTIEAGGAGGLRVAGQTGSKATTEAGYQARAVSRFKAKTKLFPDNGEYKLVIYGTAEGSKVPRKIVATFKIQPREIFVTGMAYGYLIYNKSGPGKQVIAPSNDTEPDPAKSVIATDKQSIKLLTFVQLKGMGNAFPPTWFSWVGMTGPEINNVHWISPPASGRPASTFAIAPYNGQLQLRTKWRKFRMAVARRDNHPGTSRGERWYGVAGPPEQIGEGLSVSIPVEVGTNWYGARSEWIHKLMSTNPKDKKPYKWLFVFQVPTDRKNGLMLFHRNTAPNTPPNQEYHGPNLIVGNCQVGSDARYNWAHIRRGGTMTIKSWMPNPLPGKLSTKAVWDVVTFGRNDPFFTQHPERSRLTFGGRHKDIMDWAESFVRVPYSWGGHSYGGWQSANEDMYTCSLNFHSGMTDPFAHNPGDSAKKPGYGIDCSGLVVEVGLRVGITMNGHYCADSFTNDSITEEIPSKWNVRSGDILWTSGHVAYARKYDMNSAATPYKQDAVTRLWTVETIEATYERGQQTIRWTRDTESTESFTPRRWR